MGHREISPGMDAQEWLLRSNNDGSKICAGYQQTDGAQDSSGCDAPETGSVTCERFFDGRKWGILEIL